MACKKMRAEKTMKTQKYVFQIESWYRSVFRRHIRSKATVRRRVGMVLARGHAKPA